MSNTTPLSQLLQKHDFSLFPNLLSNRNYLRASWNINLAQLDSQQVDFKQRYDHELGSQIINAGRNHSACYQFCRNVILYALFQNGNKGVLLQHRDTFALFQEYYQELRRLRIKQLSQVMSLIKGSPVKAEEVLPAATIEAMIVNESYLPLTPLQKRLCEYFYSELEDAVTDQYKYCLNTLICNVNYYAKHSDRLYQRLADFINLDDKWLSLDISLLSKDLLSNHLRLLLPQVYLTLRELSWYYPKDRELLFLCTQAALLLGYEQSAYSYMMVYAKYLKECDLEDEDDAHYEQNEDNGGLMRNIQVARSLFEQEPLAFKGDLSGTLNQHGLVSYMPLDDKETMAQLNGEYDPDLQEEIDELPFVYDKSQKEIRHNKGLDAIESSFKLKALWKHSNSIYKMNQQLVSNRDSESFYHYTRESIREEIDEFYWWMHEQMNNADLPLLTDWVDYARQGLTGDPIIDNISYFTGLKQSYHVLGNNHGLNHRQLVEKVIAEEAKDEEEENNEDLFNTLLSFDGEEEPSEKAERLSINRYIAETLAQDDCDNNKNLPYQFQAWLAQNKSASAPLKQNATLIAKVDQLLGDTNDNVVIASKVTDAAAAAAAASATTKSTAKATKAAKATKTAKATKATKSKVKASADTDSTTAKAAASANASPDTSADGYSLVSNTFFIDYDSYQQRQALQRYFIEQANFLAHAPFSGLLEQGAFAANPALFPFYREDVETVDKTNTYISEGDYSPNLELDCDVDEQPLLYSYALNKSLQNQRLYGNYDLFSELMVMPLQSFTIQCRDNHDSLPLYEKELRYTLQQGPVASIADIYQQMLKLQAANQAADNSNGNTAATATTDTTSADGSTATAADTATTSTDGSTATADANTATDTADTTTAAASDAAGQSDNTDSAAATSDNSNTDASASTPAKRTRAKSKRQATPATKDVATDVATEVATTEKCSLEAAAESLIKQLEPLEEQQVYACGVNANLLFKELLRCTPQATDYAAIAHSDKTHLLQALSHNVFLFHPDVQMPFLEHLVHLPEKWQDFGREFTQALESLSKRMDNPLWQQLYPQFSLGVEHVAAFFFYEFLYTPFLNRILEPEFKGYSAIDVDYVRMVDQCKNFPLWFFNTQTNKHEFSLFTHLQALEPPVQTWVLRYVQDYVKAHAAYMPMDLELHCDPLLPVQSDLIQGNYILNLEQMQLFVGAHLTPEQQSLLDQYAFKDRYYVERSWNGLADVYNFASNSSSAINRSETLAYGEQALKLFMGEEPQIRLEEGLQKSLQVLNTQPQFKRNVMAHYITTKQQPRMSLVVYCPNFRAFDRDLKLQTRIRHYLQALVGPTYFYYFVKEIYYISLPEAFAAFRAMSLEYNGATFSFEDKDKDKGDKGNAKAANTNAANAANTANTGNAASAVNAANNNASAANAEAGEASDSQDYQDQLLMHLTQAQRESIQRLSKEAHAFAVANNKYGVGIGGRREDWAHFINLRCFISLPLNRWPELVDCIKPKDMELDNCSYMVAYTSSRQCNVHKLIEMLSTSKGRKQFSAYAESVLSASKNKNKNKKKKNKGGASNKTESLDCLQREVTFESLTHPKWNAPEVLFERPELIPPRPDPAEEPLASRVSASDVYDPSNTSMKMRSDLICGVSKCWALSGQTQVEILYPGSLGNCDYLQALGIKAQTLVLRSIASELKSELKADSFTMTAKRLVQFAGELEQEIAQKAPNSVSVIGYAYGHFFQYVDLIFWDPVKGLEVVKEYVQKQQAIPLCSCCLQNLY